jgi:hypothetical protein
MTRGTGNAGPRASAPRRIDSALVILQAGGLCENRCMKLGELVLYLPEPRPVRVVWLAEPRWHLTFLRICVGGWSHHVTALHKRPSRTFLAIVLRFSRVGDVRGVGT